MAKDRLRDEVSLDSLLDAVLIKYNIKPQTLHSGAMNGVSTKILLCNIKKFMDKVKEIVMDRLSKGHCKNDKRCSETELTTKILELTNLLHYWLQMLFLCFCTPQLLLRKKS